MSWEAYFPFHTDDRLSIDGPWTYDGDGQVVSNEGNILELTIHLPKTNLLFFTAPEIHARLRIEAQNDGPGNRAQAEINGRPTDDDNVTINSVPQAARRTIDFSVPVEGKHLGLLLQR